MSDPTIIELNDVGKMYKIFPTKLSNFLDAIGSSWLLPWKKNDYREFWALKGINLHIGRGERVGIIGRNGAGKTTMLKLLTGNFESTEGRVQVNGSVQALMTTGAGFHPEFTGRENIEVSLTYQGLNPREIEEAIQEIVEFTELESFIDQPFKTYSQGMKARLTFTTATTISPELLIVDEILGAGDGYFITKSTERVEKLVKESGATVLIVSHALDQVTRFCTRAIWVDRGKILQDGPSLEVVKAYGQFLSMKTEQRLRAKNRAVAATGKSITTENQSYRASLVLRVAVEGGDETSCDISRIELNEDDEVYESLSVGGPQDGDRTKPGFVALDESQNWSKPNGEDGCYYRSLSPNGESKSATMGQAVFNLWSLFPDTRYSFKITYRAQNAENAWVEVLHRGKQILKHSLKQNTHSWNSEVVDLPQMLCLDSDDDQREDAPKDSGNESAREVRRWPSKGTIMIQEVSVSGPNGANQAVFNPHDVLTIDLNVRATKETELPVKPVVNIHRLDGILVSKHHPDDPFLQDFTASNQAAFRLELPDLNLGAGTYVFSVALYGREISDPDRYDLIDRSYEFEVQSYEPRYQNAVFHHPGNWRAT